MPERIQMHRRRGGWRKDHPDAVIVARPGPWGNPFRVGIHGDAATCVARYRELAGGLISMMPPQPVPSYADQAAALDHIRAHLHELRGKDLACWCKIGAPCHADVLLEIANLAAGCAATEEGDHHD